MSLVCVSGKNSKQMVPDLRFFSFMIVWKLYTFSRNRTSNFELWSFPELAIRGTTLSRDTGQHQWGSQSAAQSQVWTTPTFTTLWTHPYTCSVPYFQESINHIIYSILSYEIGLVWDDLAQLQASISILGTMKVGEAKLRCSVGYVCWMRFQLMIFQLRMGLSESNLIISQGRSVH